MFIHSRRRNQRVKCARRTALAGLFLLALSGLSGAAPLPDIPWQLPEWKYRQVVELMQLDPAGKVDTARIELTAVPPNIAPDGADVRVLDEQGEPVTFQLVTRSGEPLQGNSPPGEPFHIQFQVADRLNHFYVAYFGNPKAAPASGTWAKKLGGLMLETRANKAHTAPNSLREMLSHLAQSDMKYGEGYRRQINDPENPFGPNEQFISIYRGPIYCPDGGTYVFATDSDDASFLLIDGRLVVQRPGGATPTGKFDTTGKVELKAGLHRIEYYHVQISGGSLARAGWQPPGAGEIVIIPEDAFVRELLTEPLIVESRETPINAYFTLKTVSLLQFNSGGPVFAMVAFADRSRSAHGEIVLREWEFGDGDVSREEAPRHVFEGGKTYQVTLRCTDKLGFESVFAQEFAAPLSGAVRVETELEAAPTQPILLADETPIVQLAARFSMLPPLPVMLVTELQSAGGSTERFGEVLTVEPGKWMPLSPALSGLSAEALQQLKRVTFSLELSNTPVASRALEILAASDDPGKLRVSGDSVLTEKGQAVILRLSADALPRPERGTFSKLAGKGGTVTVAVVDDSLAGEGDEGYPAIMAGLLRARHPALRLKLQRIGPQASSSPAGRNALAAAVEQPAEVAALKPDVVILAASLRDVLRLAPVERFERNLQALVERMNAATGAQIVLVAPPPVIVNPALSQAYALAVKRVGMRKNVQVADAYSAFVRAGEAGGNGWHALYRDPGSETPLYHVAPTIEGQKLIGETVFKAMEKE